MYRYGSSKSILGGAPIETFVPADGIAPENQNRILIELHGGVFCASAYRFGEGDTFQIWTRLGSVIPIVPASVPDPDKFGASDLHFAGASPKDPLAAPAASKDVLKQFPPTLFLTGTRAPEMSSAAESHLALIELGVKSELLLFDGLDHASIRIPPSLNLCEHSSSSPNSLRKT